VPIEIFKKFIILLSPFAPHLAEEIWSGLPPLHEEGENFISSSVFKQTWPEYDPELARDEEIELVIQVNGKLRDTINVPAEISEDEIKKIALESEKIKKWIDGKEVLKVIVVKGRLVNIVIK
jgi:leucyl-tRNA synthetase